MDDRHELSVSQNLQACSRHLIGCGVIARITVGRYSNGDIANHWLRSTKSADCTSDTNGRKRLSKGHSPHNCLLVAIKLLISNTYESWQLGGLLKVLMNLKVFIIE
jgi:hypothetical protein